MFEIKRAYFTICISVILLLALGVQGLAISPPPEISAKHAYIAEVETGRVVFEENAYEQIAPGSLAKIMTALVVLENITDLNEVITVSSSALKDISGGQNAYLIKDEQMSVSDLLFCVLVRSAGDASNVLAEHVAGSTADFVKMMNEKASELGCKDTVFKNTHGIDASGQYTTAYDMYLITRAATQNPLFMNFCDVQFKRIPATNKTEDRFYTSTNYLIINNQYAIPEYYYKYARGISYTQTSLAGNSIVTLLRKDSIEYICIVLGADENPETKRKNSFFDVQALGDWVFANYGKGVIAEAGKPVCEVPVTLSAGGDSVVLLIPQEVGGIIPTGLKYDDFEKELILPDSVEAPIIKGDILGEVVFKYEGEEYARSTLVAQKSMERSELLYNLEKIELIVKTLTFKLAAGFVGILLLAVVIIIIVRGRKKGDDSRRRKY